MSRQGAGVLHSADSVGRCEQGATFYPSGEGKLGQKTAPIPPSPGREREDARAPDPACFGERLRAALAGLLAVARMQRGPRLPS